MFRVFSRDAPAKDVFHRARALFDDIEYPALMHCKSGADRAGLMSTLYMFFHEGKPINEALEQLSFKYGHVRHGKTGILDAVFKEYITYANENGKSLSSPTDFLAWVDDVYDPAEMKANFKSSILGSILTEVILRRE